MSKEQGSLDRIVELETRLAFQDNTIEELNGVIISQQKQLDRLEIIVDRLQKKLDLLIENTEGPAINGP